MKCTVEKEALLTHLQKGCNIVSRRPVLPILNNVRLEAEDNTLNLKATDLEITIRTELRSRCRIFRSDHASGKKSAGFGLQAQG